MLPRQMILFGDYAKHVTMLRTARCPADVSAYGIAMNSNSVDMMSALENETNKERNGKYKEFNKHGVLVSEGVYVNGKKHGLWREYYDHTGSIMIEEHYKHGIPHGRFSSFHPCGRVYSTGMFVDGSREGYFRVYDEQGVNIRNLYFVDNQLVVSGKEFNMALANTKSIAK